MKDQRNWTPIREACIKAAEEMGHSLSTFAGKRSTPDVKTATCKTCYGCCWIGHSETRGFSMGGRLLKYRCGTPEAAGILSGATAP